MRYQGLSPRVRGNLRVRLAGPREPGSIPACAGEPPRPPQRTDNRRVYPRVCGGTHMRLNAKMTIEGLSPRVRGNPLPRLRLTDLVGSIPACAGEPPFDNVNDNHFRVYPRVCGGTHPIIGENGYKLGLSPRVRGNRAEEVGTKVERGSIPACAGEPRSPPSRSPRTRVYPRVCGGTAWRRCGSGSSGGLSPRVRGNPRLSQARRLVRGSIPACAGEPPCRIPQLALAGVYPRVCGGTRMYWRVHSQITGLSPRVRGNRLIETSTKMDDGSIPACAGEPQFGAAPLSTCWVYPRVCGGTQIVNALTPPSEGLSPRVRGNHRGAIGCGW